jgi:hypothetical protein
MPNKEQINKSLSCPVPVQLFLGMNLVRPAEALHITGPKTPNCSLPSVNSPCAQMGARSGALFNETLPRGVMPVAGHCQHVGVAGFTLGGGYGWGSRYFGAATDNVLSMDIVTVGCADCPPDIDVCKERRRGVPMFPSDNSTCPREPVCAVTD